MPQALADGIAIAYDDLRPEGAEDEPPLVLLTGWCSSKERWREVAELCARHRRVLSTEWRGHGGSGSPTSDFGLEEMVADVLAVADDAGVEQFVPCAASHSGFVALELRRRHPERIPKLVHVDWYVVPPPPPYRAVLEQLTTDDWPAARDKLFEIWTAGSKEPSVADAIGVMRRHGPAMWQRSGRGDRGRLRPRGESDRRLGLTRATGTRAPPVRTAAGSRVPPCAGGVLGRPSVVRGAEALRRDALRDARDARRRRGRDRGLRRPLTWGS